MNIAKAFGGHTSTITGRLSWENVEGVRTPSGSRTPIVICGWLLKMRRTHRKMFMSTWNRRWFTVEDGALHWYKTSSSAEVRGRLALSDITSVRKFEGGGQGSFSFVVHAVDRNMLLRSESINDVSRWIRGLTLQIDLLHGGTFQGPPSAKNRRRSNRLLGNSATSYGVGEPMGISGQERAQQEQTHFRDINQRIQASMSEESEVKAEEASLSETPTRNADCVSDQFVPSVSMVETFENNSTPTSGKLRSHQGSGQGLRQAAGGTDGHHRAADEAILKAENEGGTRELTREMAMSPIPTSRSSSSCPSTHSFSSSDADSEGKQNRARRHGKNRIYRGGEGVSRRPSGSGTTRTPPNGHHPPPPWSPPPDHASMVARCSGQSSAHKSGETCGSNYTGMRGKNRGQATWPCGMDTPDKIEEDDDSQWGSGRKHDTGDRGRKNSRGRESSAYRERVGRESKVSGGAGRGVESDRSRGTAPMDDNRQALLAAGSSIAGTCERLDTALLEFSQEGKRGCPPLQSTCHGSPSPSIHQQGGKRASPGRSDAGKNIGWEQRNQLGRPSNNSDRDRDEEKGGGKDKGGEGRAYEWTGYRGPIKEGGSTRQLRNDSVTAMGPTRVGNFDDDEASYGRSNTPSPLRQHNKLLLSKGRGAGGPVGGRNGNVTSSDVRLKEGTSGEGHSWWGGGGSGEWKEYPLSTKDKFHGIQESSGGSTTAEDSWSLGGPDEDSTYNDGGSASINNGTHPESKRKGRARYLTEQNRKGW